MFFVHMFAVCYSQNAKGSVEVAAKCFYRRKDLPLNVLAAADTHASESGDRPLVDCGLYLLQLYGKSATLYIVGRCARVGFEENMPSWACVLLNE